MFERAQHAYGSGMCVAELAAPFIPVEGAVSCAEIDRIFAADPEIHSIVVRASSGVHLLERGDFEYIMSGRYGYGRMLYQRTSVEDIVVHTQTTTLPANATVHEAYRAMLDREPRSRFKDVLVIGPEPENFGILAAAVLLDEIARLNANDASHDHLTGLANRSSLSVRLAEALSACDPPARTLGLLFMDVDRFKIINDSLGHGAGDDLLEQFSDRLIRCVRGSDTAARIGGDEFAIILDGVTDGQKAAEVARRVIEALGPPFIIDGRDIFVTASIGIALAELDDDVTSLLQKADIAMYEAKQAGGGRFRFFHGNLAREGQDRLDAELWLRRALTDGLLDVLYQPIVDLRSGTLVAFEALVRGRGAAQGLIPPGEFLPVAEETGLIMEIDRWVLQQACRQLCEWRARYPVAEDVLVSVNFSPSHLERRGLGDELAAIVRKEGLDTGAVQIEITEGMMVRNVRKAARALEALRQHGFRLAIDDFGTGYSSLAHISKFPFDVLKIDATFVSALDSSPQNEAIVRMVLALARATGADAVAEGVEDDAKADMLRAMGCPKAQGFYFSFPLTAERVSGLLLETSLSGGRTRLPQPGFGLSTRAA